MHVFDVVSKVIYATHGWAVAEQFDDTAGNPSAFKNMNLNALDLIKDTVKELAYDGPFDEESIEELKEYLEDLEEFLNKEESEDEE